jgi:diaminopimelate decarboxylase
VPGGRGLEVTVDTACVGRHGSPSPGLSAIGRPTEDSVVGNDTLNRALHPQADRWARRILGQRDASPAAPIARQRVA